MLRWLLVILTLLLTFSPLAAQEVEWSIDASVLLSNREGGDGYTSDQTIMFTRLTPEVGFSMLDGEHVVKGGVVWFQPLIDDFTGYKLLPTLYYRYNRPDGWHATLGMMPRSLMVKRMPRYLWSDSLGHCQPNLRGVMLQLIKPAGYAEIAVDWRQLQRDDKREAFTTFLNTDWRVAGPFRLEGHLQYSHLAMSRKNASGQHVNDDVVINPMAALDFSHHTTLDSLRLSAGAIIALERDRGTDEWVKRAGFVANATARWRWLELDETFYAGQGIMPLYPALGSLLNLGDPYFNNKLYSRTDLVFHVVNNRFVDLMGSVSLHATDKVTGFWQQIACRFYLDSHTWKQRHDKDYLKNGHLEPLY